MAKTKKNIEICFQCGELRIITKRYEEIVNGSIVVSSESICSDADCQKRTTDILSKEKARRDESIANKKVFGKKPSKTKKFDD